MRRVVQCVGVFVMLTSLAVAAQQPVPPDPKLAQVSADLENAKRLANDARFDEAIARIEDALRKLREVKDAPQGQPDLVPIAINGDGNRVVITVQNQGNADLVFTERVGPTQQVRKTFTGFNVSILNANTNAPFDQHRPLGGSYTGRLAPGGTAQVQVGPITGCGGHATPIFAVVSTRAQESNTDNNRTQRPFVVRGGPCGS